MAIQEDGPTYFDEQDLAAAIAVANRLWRPGKPSPQPNKRYCAAPGGATLADIAAGLVGLAAVRVADREAGLAQVAGVERGARVVVVLLAAETVNRIGFRPTAVIPDCSDSRPLPLNIGTAPSPPIWSEDGQKEKKKPPPRAAWPFVRVMRQYELTTKLICQRSID